MYACLAPLHKALSPHMLALGLALAGAAGAATYFMLPFEPSVYTGAGLMLLGFLGLVWIPSWRTLGWCLWYFGLMFALAHNQVLQAQRTALPWQVLSAQAHWVAGTVAAVHNGTTATRHTVELAPATLYGLPNGPLTVPTLRVGVATAWLANIQEGEGMAARVQLYPPSPAGFEGGYDDRLRRFLTPFPLYGFVQGKPEATTPHTPLPRTPWGAFGTWFEGLRQHVLGLTSGHAQGVLAALLVAEQRQIPAELREAYRRAGLSHLLAVSGLQLTLVGGGVFMLVRWLLACWPLLALTINTKAITAMAGLMAAGVYAGLAGAPVSVQRALLMVAFLMLAVLLGRIRSLPRTWAVAMLVVLAIHPFSVMGAAFQLSFAAVAGLILLGFGRGQPQTFPQKALWLYHSSLAAAWATAPFLAFQFGQFNLLGVAANLLAIPAMAPITWAAFGGLVLMPFNLHEPLLWLAGLGATWVNTWATWVAAAPLATLHLPAWMAWGIALATPVGLGLVVAPVRWGSVYSMLLLVLLGGGIAAWQVLQPPHVMVASGGAMATTQTHLLWADSNRLANQWERTTYSNLTPQLPIQGCTPQACAYPTPAGVVVRLANPPTPEDCRNARWIITTTPPTPCPNQTLVEGTFLHAYTHALGWRITLPTCQRVWQKGIKPC